MQVLVQLMNLERWLFVAPFIGSINVTSEVYGSSNICFTYDWLAGSLDGPGCVLEGAGVDPVGEVPHAPHRRRRRRLRGRALDGL